MITVSILGMDYYEAIRRTKPLHRKLVDAYGIEENELEFFAPESFIIHDGFEQTSFRLNIKVEAPEEFMYKEEEIAAIIKDALKDVAIHKRILFTYFDPIHEYLDIDESYPEYMNDDNTVKAEDEHDHEEEEQEYRETYEEPYMGDIISQFDEYVQEHPNASNEEVYKALTEIREKVTASHHQNGDDDVDEDNIDNRD